MHLSDIWNKFDNGAVYQNVRKNTNMNSPVTDLSSLDLRCNVGGLTGGTTTTASVTAGSVHTFSLDQAVYHQGPVSFYMSKAPSGVSLSSYDGSGDWFKIAEIGPTFPSSCSPSWNLAASYSVTIPKSVPNGNYLLRAEQLGIHNPAGAPQFYINCAQIAVTGGGSGSPSPLTKIPGHVKASDSGYTVSLAFVCATVDPAANIV